MDYRIEATLDYDFADPADVLLAIEAAPLGDQRLIEDMMTVEGGGPLRPVAAAEGVGRRTWTLAHGRLGVRYRALVAVERSPAPLEPLAVAMRADLPAEVLPYLWPSRYCEADRFEGFVARRFGPGESGAEIAAMADWIRRALSYQPGSSDTATTAVEAFVARRGVCRDYAHLLAAFARAGGVPARLVSAYAADLDPPDFHALVEVWLGNGWHLVDPTGLARVRDIVRICVGRDATDIAFMTSFGPATLVAQSVSVVAAP
jgi:transglutaminase-like putative cysteine protease